MQRILTKNFISCYSCFLTITLLMSHHDITCHSFIKNYCWTHTLLQQLALFIRA
eukprot:UN27764